MYLFYENNNIQDYILLRDGINYNKLTWGDTKRSNPTIMCLNSAIKNNIITEVLRFHLESLWNMHKHGKSFSRNSWCMMHLAFCIWHVDPGIIIDICWKFGAPSFIVRFLVWYVTPLLSWLTHITIKIFNWLKSV